MIKYVLVHLMHIYKKLAEVDKVMAEHEIKIALIFLLIALMKLQ